MRVSIIGIGAIGGTIAKKLAKGGYKVSIANSKGKSAVEKFASEIGAEPRDISTISKDAEVLILSIPFGAIPKLSKDIFQNLPNNALVIDTTNYYPEIRKEDFDESKPESVWVSEQIGRKVIKTFNSILAHSLQNFGKNKGENNRLAIQVAGDDEEQKKIAMKLINDCGFEPYDNGNLDNSWSQQPNSAGYCCDYTCDELKKIKEKSKQTRESVKENRKKIFGNFAELTGGDYSHENIIKINRKYNI